MDFLMRQIYGGEDVTPQKASPETEVEDVVTLLVREAALKHSISQHESFKTAGDYGAPVDIGLPLAKRASDGRAALACGQSKGKGARIERCGNGWVKEYDAAGNLVCGYLEE
jgi:hypothetical protein